ncbi:MAG: glutamate-5-semialdehyde dehydrogenase [Epulopiscium sp. Nuni2H_MBin001]|nr:MAG: glutamate-5-semialdehyde dehydrogenase [Epulopiscium sp. Nuni2H_MBin001]
MEVEVKGKKLKAAAKVLRTLSSKQKNEVLDEIKHALLENSQSIMTANDKDVVQAKKIGISESLIDRLSLSYARLESICNSIDVVIGLKDPVGVCSYGHTMENGMELLKKTVPMGVISIIYESRPNVTVDAVVLAIKSGNAILLRGSSMAHNSNMAIVAAIKQGLSNVNIPSDAVMLIEDMNRDVVKQIITANEYIDLVIPRGGAELINMVVSNATVPVVETGVGNCHLFIDESASMDMALRIFENAKIQRPSVCNSIETLLVHENIARSFLGACVKDFDGVVKFLGCEETRKLIPCEPATPSDFATEFLDYVIAVKVVKDIDEAIRHIEQYSTGHSECIVTNNYENANKFTLHVDAACVYVNASTRFTDGGEFGFGCEMGISTQKMHVRGPVGLDHLVSSKYIIHGDGQIR